MLGLWIGVALGQTCDATTLSAPSDPLSVAWVSPVRRKVAGRTWLWVVPTRDLRAFAKDQSTGRALQWLGLRRRDTEPSRRWKVVVFDAAAADLCRPMGDDGTGEVAGLARCEDRQSTDPDRNQSCGQRLDRKTGTASVTAYRAQWSTLATNGFCVLPLERL